METERQPPRHSSTLLVPGPPASTPGDAERTETTRAGEDESAPHMAWASEIANPGGADVWGKKFFDRSLDKAIFGLESENYSKMGLCRDFILVKSGL